MSATPELKRPRSTGRDAPSPQATAQHAAALLERALTRARLAIAWERIWPPVAQAAVVAAAFLTLSWAGLWLALPPLARLGGVILFAALLAWRLAPLVRLRVPGRAEGLARLDRESAIAHRPATAIADPLATRPDDPVGAALWRAHVARTLSAARALKAGLPRPGMAARDPQALRALALLSVVAAFFLSDGQALSRLRAAFDWRGVVEHPPYRLDAWVDPPSYTGRPPVVLAGLRSDDPADHAATALTVPQGSHLVVRMVGLDPKTLKLDGALTLEKPEPDPAGAPADGAAPPPRASAPVEQRFIIAGPGSVVFSAPDGRSLMWRFSTLPDGRPTIAFVKDPAPGPRNSLVLTYRIEDDYGVKEAGARFAAAPPEAPLFPRPGATPPAAGTPLVAAPDFALALPPRGGKTGAQTTKDLVAHPWAGTRVTVTLTARDEAGNGAESEARTFRLPTRAFTNPMARALIEERRRLALDIAARKRVAGVLQALSLAPDRFGMDAGEYLGLRTAHWRLVNARTEDDLRGVVDYLWEMAVAIEDGNLTDAQRQLKAAQDALREALERGAGDEEIKRLMQDLRAAMDKMMRQLAEEAQRDGGTDARPLDQNTRVLSPQDLQRMMDRMENLARSGNRDAARQMLDELQAMMEGMRPGNRQAGRQQGQQQSELGNMIQEQQRLRDQTYRQGQQGRQGQRGQQGENGEQGEGDFGSLQKGQQALRDQLGKMLEDLRRMQQGQGQQGQGQDGEGDQGSGAMGRAGDAFGRAEQAMRDAEGALGEGNGRSALDSQGRALQALRQGAQSLAEAQQGNSDGPGPGGPSGEHARRTDPLGRPLRSQDYGDDYTVKVPEEMDVQRARQVLEELRRRFEDATRPQLELDYIERLLNPDAYR